MTDRFGDERLLVICSSTVLVMAGQGVISPVLPLFARDFGVTATVVGLTLTVFGLARLVLNIPAGILADRFGRRVLLVGGPLITALGMVGSGLAPSIWVLLAWRVVAGAGSALYMTGAQIYLIDIAGDDRRARYMATNQAALLLGVSVGPAIGGLLAEGYGLRAPFLVVGAGAVATAIYGFIRLPETLRTEPTGDPVAIADQGAGGGGDQRDDREVGDPDPDPATERRAGDRGGRLALATSKQFLAVGVVSFSIFAVRSGYRLTLVPLEGVDRFGLDTGDLGLIFTGLSAIGLVLIGPAGWVADRLGRKVAIVPNGYVAAAGVALTALSPNLGWFIAGLIVAAVGTNVTGPAPAAFVADIAPPHLRGPAMGLYRTWGDLGIVVGPVVGGAIADASSVSGAMMAIAALVTVAVTWFLFVAEEPAPANGRRVQAPG